MSTEFENVAILKDAYQRWHDTKAGSVDHWLSLMTDDVQFRSLADVVHYFAGLTSEWEMIYHRIDEYITQGDRVVAVGQVSFKHKRTGKTLETPKADFDKFRDAKICEFFEFYDTADAIEKATASS